MNNLNNFEGDSKMRNRIMYFLEVSNLTLEDLKVSLKDKIREESIEDLVLCKKDPSLFEAQLISKVLNIPVDVLFPNNVKDIETLKPETSEYLICFEYCCETVAQIIMASSLDEAREAGREFIMEETGDRSADLCVVKLSDIPRMHNVKYKF